MRPEAKPALTSAAADEIMSCIFDNDCVLRNGTSMRICRRLKRMHTAKIVFNRKVHVGNDVLCLGGIDRVVWDASLAALGSGIGWIRDIAAISQSTSGP
jgi:hypothetical protein